MNSDTSDPINSYLTGNISAFSPDVRVAIYDAQAKAAEDGVDLRKCSVKYTVSRVKGAWVAILIVFCDGIVRQFIGSNQDE